MDVRCPECDTLYEIDTRQLRGSASTLKCSQCEHIFHMQTHAAFTQENQRRWMLRSQASGDIRYFLGFDELHRWILQGVVSTQDDISRTGRRWKTLASIGEFMPIFQALDSIASIANARQKKESRDLPSAAPSTSPPFVRSPPVAASSVPAPRPRAPSGQSEPAPRPRMGTSRQFALPPNQNPARPSAAPSSTARTDTPISSAPWATPPGPPKPLANTPSRGQQTAPRTRPPTGEHPADHDGWSLGDLPLSQGAGPELDSRGRDRSGAHPLPPAPSAQYPSIDRAASEAAPSRSMTPIILTALLVLGAGAALYMVYPPFVENILGPKSSPNTPESSRTALADEASPANAPEGAASSQKEVDLATTEAANEALEAQNKNFIAALEAARPLINTALNTGSKKAEDAAPKEPKQLSVNALLASANSALKAGKSEQAREQYHQVLSRERSNSSAITGLGWSLIALNNAPAAAAQFNKAIALNPSYGDAYIGLGKAKRDMGDPQGALNAYQGYLDKFPSGSKASIARHQADKLKLAIGQ